VGVIAIDSNIFIRALDDPGHLGEKSRIFLKNLTQTTDKAFISVMVLEEFFVRVYKEKRDKEMTRIMNLLTLGEFISLVDINTQIALLAAEIRADYNIKAPDALHLASAIEAGAKIFVTTDKRLPRKIGKLTIKVLD